MTSKLGIKAEDICKALEDKHAKDLTFQELRLSSGFALQSRVDFYALNVAPSTGNVATAYEVKVSRADFRKDNHKKQRGARLFSDYFYYIAPVGVIPPDEVPDWAGLLEVERVETKYTPSGYALRVRELISAPKRDKDMPSWGLVVSMLRRERKSNAR